MTTRSPTAEAIRSAIPAHPASITGGVDACAVTSSVLRRSSSHALRRSRPPRSTEGFPTAMTATDVPQPGPYFYPQPMVAPVQRPSNWAGITALSIGIPGAAFAFVPVVCAVTAVLLGVPATVFGGIAVHRCYSGKATNKVMSGWGLGLGIWSLAGWFPLWLAVTVLLHSGG